jgi:pescadillo protein
LPPHLSPWVDNEEEGYQPAYAEEIERLRNGEVVAHDEADDQEMEVDSNEAEEMEGTAESYKSDSEDEEEVDDEEDEEGAKKKKARAEKRQKREVSYFFASTFCTGGLFLSILCELQEEETHALAKTMMSRKASHLYGRMQHGIAQRKAKVDDLQTRRRVIEDENRSKRVDEQGRTPLKQKVERLKKEQQAIMKEYSNTGGSMKGKKNKNKKST